MSFEAALAIYAGAGILYVGFWSLAGFLSGEGFRMWMNAPWSAALFGSFASAGYLIVELLGKL